MNKAEAKATTITIPTTLSILSILQTPECILLSDHNNQTIYHLYLAEYGKYFH